MGCPDPGPVENGYKSPPEGPYHHGDALLYSCNDGYRVKEHSIIECLNGQFDKNIPRCLDSSSGGYSIETEIHTKNVPNCVSKILIFNLVHHTGMTKIFMSPIDGHSYCSVSMFFSYSNFIGVKLGVIVGAVCGGLLAFVIPAALVFCCVALMLEASKWQDILGEIPFSCIHLLGMRTISELFVILMMFLSFLRAQHKTQSLVVKLAVVCFFSTEEKSSHPQDV